MPPSLNEYLPLLRPDASLILPQFSSSFLVEFRCDGGVFGISAITSHHIPMFSEMPNLKKLRLEYCLTELHSTSFSSLTDLDLKWKSLKSLNVKYAFGDNSVDC
jgi:hypothetical protein